MLALLRRLGDLDCRRRPSSGATSAGHGHPLPPTAQCRRRLLADVHTKVMQERLGHSSVAFTLDIYSHAIPTLQGEAAQKVATLFDEAR